MESPLSDSDGVLLDDLTDALRPSQGSAATAVKAGGYAAFSFRTMDEELELISLVYDSLLDQLEADGRRSAVVPRTLVFEAADVSIEIEVDHGRVVGQIAPPTAGTVSVDYASGKRGLEQVDDLGCFAFTLAAPGPIRLRLDTDHGSAVSEWVTLPSGT
jgi:hypothetical protein